MFTKFYKGRMIYIYIYMYEMIIFCSYLLININICSLMQNNISNINISYYTFLLTKRL